VVHVALDDARAYAAWAGGRLPTEVEWEYAASLGLDEPDRPDSGALGPRGEHRANIWQGRFPAGDSGDDGFIGRAPVGCYPPARIATFDMIGNVWEWTDTLIDAGRHTMKGGSYLCAADHCHRYRVPARQGFEDDFSAGHLGFRIVRETRP
jgi:formylglycine-generating enzyme required for sulfatase activity